MSILLFFFFFQAEDGIRDADVTGVQTCALPISPTNSTAHLDIVMMVSGASLKRLIHFLSPPDLSMTARGTWSASITKRVRRWSLCTMSLTAKCSAHISMAGQNGMNVTLAAGQGS